MQEKVLSISTAGIDTTLPQAPVRGRVVKSKWARNLLTFLMVVGPGLIVMVADNDAGAVSTYVQTGAQYGTRLLWVLLLLWPTTYFIQEMVIRLGIATGKGHAAMIYQRFGKWWGLFSLLDLELVNFLTLVTEFAAIALALSHLGISPNVGVPIAAIGLVAMVLTGSYLRWERIVIVLCVLDLAWFLIAFRLRPTSGEMFHNLLVPGLPHGGLTSNLVFMVIAIVGTTIAPWQLFFQQSCIADKKLRFADVKWARLDTFLGACITITVAGCMMIAGNAALRSGINFADPAQMANALHFAIGSEWDPRRHSAADDQRRCTWHDCNLALQRVGVWRSPRMASQPPNACAEGERLLSDVHRVCRTGSGHRANSTSTATVDHPWRAGAGGNHAAVGDHLSAAAAERQRVAGRAVRQQTLEQRGELDHYRCPLRSFINFGGAGRRPQLVPPGLIRFTLIFSRRCNMSVLGMLRPRLAIDDEVPENHFLVVHPLDDRPEEKSDTTNLGPMPMTPTVKYSLLTLRGYLVLMMLLVFYHVLDLAGLFGHH